MPITPRELLDTLKAMTQAERKELRGLVFGEPISSTITSGIVTVSATSGEGCKPLRRPNRTAPRDPKELAKELGDKLRDAGVLIEPRFPHDCDRCTFLGHYRHFGRDNDLYWCDGGSIINVIARYGPDAEYESGLLPGWTMPEDAPLCEAVRRAEAMGLDVGRSIYANARKMEVPASWLEKRKKFAEEEACMAPKPDRLALIRQALAKHPVIPSRMEELVAMMDRALAIEETGELQIHVDQLIGSGRCDGFLDTRENLL